MWSYLIMITEKQAREFLKLHNKKIQDWFELTGKNDAIDFFLRATEHIEVDLEEGIEINGYESITGNPILFSTASTSGE
jgi:hypothetical protein